MASRQDRAALLENLSLLVSSGMGISLSLETLVTDARSRGMQRLLERLREDVESGFPLWQAIDRSKLFNESTVSLMKIGEETGRLSENLRLVNDREEKERMLRSRLRSATLYPAFVFVLTAGIGVGIAWFILPELSRVFSELRIALPLPTKVLIATGGFFEQYGTFAVPTFFVGLVALIYFLFFFRRTRFIGQAILFVFPGTRRLVQEVELGRFGYLLGTLLNAGIPISEALHSLIGTSFFPQYRKAYEHLAKSVRDGYSFEASFASFPKSLQLFPPSVRQLIATGERSGNLSATFLKISETYEAKSEATTKNLTVLLEPVLLVIVWLGVVGVALAVILPIYSLIGQLNAGEQGAPSSQTETTAPQDPVESGTDAATIVEPVVPESSLKSSATGEEKTLTILPTGIGYLNVRDAPSKEGKIIGRVTPGTMYTYQSEQGGWFEIIVGEQCSLLQLPCESGAETGWISGDYATPNANNEGVYAP